MRAAARSVRPALLHVHGRQSAARLEHRRRGDGVGIPRPHGCHHWTADPGQERGAHDLRGAGDARRAVHVLERQVCARVGAAHRGVQAGPALRVAAAVLAARSCRRGALCRRGLDDHLLRLGLGRRDPLVPVQAGRGQGALGRRTARLRRHWLRLPAVQHPERPQGAPFRWPRRRPQRCPGPLEP
eukprot:1776270-Rhodomonas_salina.2